MKYFYLKVVLIVMLFASYAGFSKIMALTEFFPESKNQNAKAFRQLQLLAKEGDRESQNKLGWMYDQGLGTLEDPKVAVKWYLKSADQGFKQAQINIGVMYEMGRGVTQNLVEAKKWYSKANS
tara:strand:+ start:771 stop:1139 length:369 start_codon:yes stop_codon:yes gene_type:complete